METLVVVITAALVLASWGLYALVLNLGRTR
jgi:hypothetical protein